MPNPSQTIQRACRLLRARVRFKNASFALGGVMSNDADTERIRKATRLYTETWVVPLLDAIESGDTATLQLFLRGEHGDKMNGERAKEPSHA